MATDKTTGQIEITENGQPVLTYNYAKVEPGPIYQEVAPGNRIYAVARSDYIHPLNGLAGEALTKDWSRDHPHHRGIYWAWPEVDWRGQRGDLHALQKVFARPEGWTRTSARGDYAQIEARNRWLWEDRDPIVREQVLIRAWRTTTEGRWVDLEFRFVALGDPVQVARRGTEAYGGLNLRFSAVRDQQIVKHTDPAESQPRRAWGEMAGTFSNAAQSAGVVILPDAQNPDYPGDWVDYPNLNWLQPTFPAKGTRYELRVDRPLILRYRLWIHAGAAASDAACARQWDLWQKAPRS